MGESKTAGGPKKRNRVVVSCTECHRRKQKCDRGLPCANCRTRRREASCSYEAGEPSCRPRKQRPQTSPPPQETKEPLSAVAATWGYGQTGASTIALLKRIEAAPSCDADEDDAVATAHSSRETLALRDKYKSLVRQLPARSFLDRLVALFAREFNWQYYCVDGDIFTDQLRRWNNLPFRIFSTDGPDGIPTSLRAFPAVLFQMIATALLVLSEQEEEEFAALKYAANMTFEDLACDYSASGAEIVALFGKKALSVTTIQAEFLRASFLKFTANVAESWHMLGIAIRDAQELGMHRDALDPKPAGTGVESLLETQWLVERRRRLYMVLAIWDINMSLILGRPGTIDWRHGSPSLPIDAPTPINRSKTPVACRDAEKDAPTPLTRLLWLHQLSLPLRDIQDLEQDGPCPRDFSKVDAVHGKIMSLHDSTPAIFRLQNPDTSWDDDADVAPWIQVSRYYFQLLHAFSLMALHRPYVFHRKQSRDEALSAGLTMLEMQRLMFEGLSSASWRNFMLFFGAFDAIVLIASIYILFPEQHPEHRLLAVTHIHWAIERFATMQHRNPLARSAQGVLRAISGRFTKALGSSGPDEAEKRCFKRGPSETTSADLDGKQLPELMDNGAGSESTEDSAGLQVPGETWLSAFAPDGLSSIMPTFATSDLIFNDLAAVQDNGDVADAGGFEWQFGGDIGDGTLWQVLNEFQPR